MMKLDENLLRGLRYVVSNLEHAPHTKTTDLVVFRELLPPVRVFDNLWRDFLKSKGLPHVYGERAVTVDDDSYRFYTYIRESFVGVAPFVPEPDLNHTPFFAGVGTQNIQFSWVWNRILIVEKTQSVRQTILDNLPRELLVVALKNPLHQLSNWDEGTRFLSLLSANLQVRNSPALQAAAALDAMLRGPGSAVHEAAVIIWTSLLLNFLRTLTFPLKPMKLKEMACSYLENHRVLNGSESNTLKAMKATLLTFKASDWLDALHGLVVTSEAPKTDVFVGLDPMPLVRAPFAHVKTSGYCKEKSKPGGCQLHNLQCGYPACDRRP